MHWHGVIHSDHGLQLASLVVVIAMGVTQGVDVAFFGGSLKASRATGIPHERWRVQFSFLGQNVCRHAFSLLTGIGVSVLHDARKSALDNKVSWSPSSERGFHGGAIKNHWKPAAYLGARQWLEWYAETHAEWSPM